ISTGEVFSIINADGAFNHISRDKYGGRTALPISKVCVEFSKSVFEEREQAMIALKKGIFALALSTLVAAPAYSFSSSTGGKVHEDITRQALHDTISDANLDFIVKAIDSQNAPGSEGESEGRRHFADGNFSAALAYMDREKKQALNYAGSADTD